MEIKTLQYLIELGEGKGTTQIARDFYISRQAVSQAVHGLEKEVGATLFVRTKGGITLTVAGKCVYAHAKVIMRELQGIKSELATLSGVKEYLLRVGFGKAIYTGCPLSFFDTFRREHPEIELSVRYGHVNEMFECLEQGVIDLMISASPFSAEKYESILIKKQPVYGVVRRDAFADGQKSLSAWDLKDRTLLFIKEHFRFSESILQFMEKEGIPVRAAYSSDSELIISLRTIRDNPGMVYLTNGNWQNIVRLPEDLMVLPLEDLERPGMPSSNIRAIRLKNRPLTQEMSRFIDALKKAMNVPAYEG